VIYKRETLSIVMLEWSEIVAIYNTPDIVVTNRRTKYFTK